jgi:glycosyltransferase involved in cell wall biosynthesis
VPNAVFVVRGDGSLRSYHERLAEEVGVAGGVRFTGRIEPSELPFFYSACDVFVVPSVLEAFGLATVEATACGKPVIGTDVGGIPDTITDGLNGFLVKPRDPEVLAEKISVLLKDSGLRERMGKASREIADKRFNIEERTRRIIRPYESLVGTAI